MSENKPKQNQKWKKLQNQLFHMVSVGVIDEPVNQAYDVISTGALIVNLAAAIMNTFDKLHAQYGEIFAVIEAVTVVFFAIDYVLRVITAPCLYPEVNAGRAVRKYILSFAGIIDILSFLPYYLPFFFPGGTTAFRMFRVARIMRLFRINAYYDSLNVITEVISNKKQQLLSSVFIIAVLMVASSLCMYSLEHEAQPEVFSNAFSGIWWSASTLLTVGYGDIYPVTTMGQFFGIFIAFLGVGIVAIPTGIISAGFVEQHQKLKLLGDAPENNVHFIKIELRHGDVWIGKDVSDIGFPAGTVVAAIQRAGRTIIPRGHVTLKEGDRLILGAERLKDDTPVNLKEIVIDKEHAWNGVAIRDLDISRQSFIVMVKRGEKSVIPRGGLVLCEKDVVYMYSNSGA